RSDRRGDSPPERPSDKGNAVRPGQAGSTVGDFRAVPSPGLPVASPVEAPRRRRPSGAPPRLARSIGATGKAWLAASVVVLVWLVAIKRIVRAERITDRIDAVVSRGLAQRRTAWITAVAKVVDRIGAKETWIVATAALVVALIVLKRWRHLFTFLFVLAAFSVVSNIV